MFGGLHLLGEAPGPLELAPGGFPDWLEPKVPEGDFDMISVAYYSPDSNYPYQRISNYNVPLAEQTQQLEGLGAFDNRPMSKLPTHANYMAASRGPRSRFAYVGR